MRYSDEYQYEDYNSVTNEVEELYSYDDVYDYDDQADSDEVEWENYYHNIADEIVED